METRLLQDGLRPNADPVERLLHLWHLYLRTEGSMNAARLEVKALQAAHDRENMEVKVPFYLIKKNTPHKCEHPGITAMDT